MCVNVLQNPERCTANDSVLMIRIGVCFVYATAHVFVFSFAFTHVRITVFRVPYNYNYHRPTIFFFPHLVLTISRTHRTDPVIGYWWPMLP